MRLILGILFLTACSSSSAAPAQTCTYDDYTNGPVSSSMCGAICMPPGGECCDPNLPKWCPSGTYCYGTQCAQVRQ